MCFLPEKLAGVARGGRQWLGALFVTTLAVGSTDALAQEGVQQTGRSAQEAPALPRFNVNEYLIRGNTVLDNKTIEHAVLPFMGPGKTLDDVNGARDALTKAYHDLGYQSVVVDLPEQQVTGGVIRLQVTETTLGRVRVVGAQYSSPTNIKEELPALAEGKVPNFTAAQAQLTAINQSGKKQVVPLLRPGEKNGTLDMDLKVDDQSPWRASASLSNDYSADTTHLRASATIGHDNLLQRGHAASLTLFTSPEDTDEVKVWSGSYQMPLSGTPWNLQLSGYQSDSAVATIGGTNVLGKGHTFGLSGIYKLPAAGDWSGTLSLGIDFKDFKQQLRFGGAANEVPIRYAPVSFGYNGYRWTESARTSLGLTATGGFRSIFGYGSSEQEFDDQRFKAGPSFMVLKADFGHTQAFADRSELAARLNGQLSSGPLVSNEQMAAGGVNTVRGYLSAEATGDYGYVASLEWHTPSYAKQLGSAVDEWRLYGFAEGAQLWIHDPLPEQNSRFSLASVGLGTRIQLANGVSGNLDWGYPLKDLDPLKKARPKLHFSIRANY